MMRNPSKACNMDVIKEKCFNDHHCFRFLIFRFVFIIFAACREARDTFYIQSDLWDESWKSSNSIITSNKTPPKRTWDALVVPLITTKF